MCQLYGNCKKAPAYKVIHKAVGARAAYVKEACADCASKIGMHSPQGALINQSGMESAFYKLEKLK